MPPETFTAVHPWLAPFATHQRPMVAAWFHYSVAQGCRTPESVVAMVQRLVSAKLEWSVSPTSIQVCEVVLASLAHRRAQALSYAATLLNHGGSPDAA